MKDKELNQIAAIEKAIAEKYGTERLQTPLANWDETKEKEYLSQMKAVLSKNKEK
jgi:hypothetical protein